MSDNKLGGVPSKTREALFAMLEVVTDNSDDAWAKAIKKLTRIGPEQALKRMKKK